MCFSQRCCSFRSFFLLMINISSGKEKTFKAFFPSAPNLGVGKPEKLLSETQKTSSSVPQQWNKELSSVRVCSVCRTQTRLDLHSFMLAEKEGVMKRHMVNHISEARYPPRAAPALLPEHVSSSLLLNHMAAVSTCQGGKNCLIISIS